jgi:hypothetical protein
VGADGAGADVEEGCRNGEVEEREGS